MTPEELDARANDFEAFAPDSPIATLGGEEAIVESFRAIQNVGR